MLWPAFILGLFGGVHCVGMCGPIALALPLGKAGSWRFAFGRILYNAGRLVSYSFLGGIVALAGVGAAMFELGQYLSIGFGLLMTVWGIMQLVGVSVRSSGSNFFKDRLLSFLGQRMQSGHPIDLFLAGIGNGFLPCGLVYLGLGYAALSTTIIQGMSTMALFGLGTFPVMLAVSLAGRWVTPAFRTALNRALPIVVIAVGTLLIIRGMGLGIPYLSPEWVSTEQGVSCCHAK